MRVLLLANHLNIGGIAVYLRNLCAGLRQQGLDLVVASRGGTVVADLVRMGVAHEEVPLMTKCEVSPKVWLSARRLEKILKKKPVDVIHANTRVTQVLAALVSRATGIPYVSTCHGYFRPRWSRRVFPCWGKKVIAVSQQVRQHLVKDFGVPDKDIALILNGIDVARFQGIPRENRDAERARMGLDPLKKVIGHIGRLSSVKGQRYLVEAAALMKGRGDCQWLVIGDGPEETELRQMIRKRGLQRDFFILPSCPDTAVALSVMDIFVMPSLQEGLGLSILEAQAAGVPVAASSVGGILTVVGDTDTGLLFGPADPSAIERCVVRLMEDTALRVRVIERARQQVWENFSLERMARETAELYTSL